MGVARDALQVQCTIVQVVQSWSARQDRGRRRRSSRRLVCLQHETTLQLDLGSSRSSTWFKSYTRYGKQAVDGAGRDAEGERVSAHAGPVGLGQRATPPSTSVSARRAPCRPSSLSHRYSRRRQRRQAIRAVSFACPGAVRRVTRRSRCSCSLRLRHISSSTGARPSTFRPRQRRRWHNHIAPTPSSGQMCLRTRTGSRRTRRTLRCSSRRSTAR
jgi:hypothetical protein